MRGKTCRWLERGLLMVALGMPAAGEADEASWLETSLHAYTDDIRRIYTDPRERRGLLLGYTHVQAAARVIARPRSGGRPEFCSATLVTKSFVLTAAHCVCRDLPTFAECHDQKAPDSLDVDVYLPGSGVHRGQEVLVSPLYDSRDVRRALAGSSLGDLALIRLASEADELPAALGSIVPGQSRAVVGFGQFVLTADEGAAIGVPTGPFLAGAGVTAIPRFLAHCRGKQIDIVCAQYVADDVENLRLSSALCAGDSGGGVFERASVPPRLLAVSSMRLEIRSSVECADEDSTQSVFTRIDAHVEWIKSIIGQEKEVSLRESPYLCEDLLMVSDPDSGSTLTMPPILQRRMLTITAVNFKQMRSGKEVIIGSSDPVCASVSRRSDILRCEIQPMGKTVFTAEGPGLIQVTSCLKKD